MEIVLLVYILSSYELERFVNKIRRKRFVAHYLQYAVHKSRKSRFALSHTYAESYIRRNGNSVELVDVEIFACLKSRSDIVLSDFERKAVERETHSSMNSLLGACLLRIEYRRLYLCAESAVAELNVAYRTFDIERYLVDNDIYAHSAEKYSYELGGYGYNYLIRMDTCLDYIVGFSYRSFVRYIRRIVRERDFRACRSADSARKDLCEVDPAYLDFRQTKVAEIDVNVALFHEYVEDCLIILIVNAEMYLEISDYVRYHFLEEEVRISGSYELSDPGKECKTDICLEYYVVFTVESRKNIESEQVVKFHILGKYSVKETAERYVEISLASGKRAEGNFAFELEVHRLVFAETRKHILVEVYPIVEVEFESADRERKFVIFYIADVELSKHVYRIESAF